MSKLLSECTSFKLGCNAQMTKVVKLELIPHPDMHIFFEKRRQLKVNVRLI